MSESVTPHLQAPDQLTLGTLDDLDTVRAHARTNLWQVVRRQALLVGACAVLAGVGAAFVTTRLPRLYEAAAAIRIDPNSTQLSTIGVPGTPSEVELPTEVEMLRSRALAGAVVDSLGLRLQLQSPLHVVRSDVVASARVARDAGPNLFRVVSVAGGRFAVLDAAGDTIARAVGVGQTVRAAGTAFVLTPGAAAAAPLVFTLLPFEEAVDSLQAGTDVSRRSRDAVFVDVRYRSVDPELARDVANAVARQFISERQDVRQLEGRQSVAFLRDQLVRVSAQLRGAERTLRDFREGAQVVSLPDQASSGVHRRAEVQAQRNALATERDALKRLLDSTRTARAGGGSSVDRRLLAFPTLLRSGAGAGLQSALTAAEEQRAALLTRRSPRDLEVQAVEARIGEIRGQIRDEVQTYEQGLSDQVSGLDAVLRRSDGELATFPRKQLRLNELERTAKTTESVYTMLQARLKEAEIAAAVVDPTARLVDAAVLPTYPVSPKPLLNVLLGTTAGALLGLAGAGLRERRDRSLRTRHQLFAVTGLPVLGMIPHLRYSGRLAWLRRTGRPFGTGRARVNPPVTGGAPALMSAAAALHADDVLSFAMANERLAMNVALGGEQLPSKVLVVTSALPSDGKTTVAMNLALAHARNGRRVLLIDADLRNGQVGTLLGLPRTAGLSDLLDGSADIGAVLTRVPSDAGSDLHVMPCGTLTHNAARLFSGDDLQALLEWARERYDAVVVDTPPVNAVADAVLIASKGDSILLVARFGATTLDALAFAMEQLHVVRASVTGAVLNDVDSSLDAEANGLYGYGGLYGPARSTEWTGIRLAPPA